MHRATPWGRASRPALPVALAAALLMLPTSAVPPAAAAEQPAVLIVLDSSGSMNRTDPGGTTLMAGAKAAVAQVVEQLPAGAPVGLRAYGHTYTGEDEATGCADTALLAPVGPDQAAVVAAADSLQPTGFTPIGASLRAAAQDLPGGEGTVILVSDGEDTCTPPEPCEVARELAEQGIALTVEAVGLALEGEEARAQLECIAEATGGSYRDAADAAGLARTLVDLSSRAYRAAAAGQVVEGGASPADAPDLDSGVYSDTILVPEQLFYAVDVAPGEVVTLRVTQAARPGADLLRNFDVEANGESGGRVTAGEYESVGADTSMSRVIVIDGDVETPGRWNLSLLSETLYADDQQGVEFAVQIGVERVGGEPEPRATPSATASESPSELGAADDLATAPVSDAGSRVPGWLVAVLAGLVLVLLAAVAALAYALRTVSRRQQGSPPPAG